MMCKGGMANQQKHDPYNDDHDIDDAYDDNNDDNNDVQGWGACATYTQSAPPFIYWLQPDWEHLPSLIVMS